MSGKSSLADYQKALKAPLSQFERYLKSLTESFEPEIRDVVVEVLRHPGKRLRPGFVFACAGILENPPPRALRFAGIVELIHLSSLIHDDILDGALIRHGAPTHHVVFDARTSVLTGDTLFLCANELASEEDDGWLGRAVAAAAKATCSGEIAQGLAAGKMLTYAAYERFILLKTGKLFGLSCELGGVLKGSSEPQREMLKRYGENFGVAYQLYDDAVDVWGTQEKFQKTLGSDQSQRKWTLPWILLEAKIGEVAMEPLWGDRAKALAAFEAHDVLNECRRAFESYLTRAKEAIASFENRSFLQLPLDYLREKWLSLGEKEKTLSPAFAKATADCRVAEK
jgi:octaprenyl-diphosphate synthase